MKSPSDISERLTKQWQNGSMREQRLLSADAWPIQVGIGFPSAQLFVEQPAAVREHIATWRKIKIGQVNWAEKKYIKSSAPITLPKDWQINSPSDWAAATRNANVKKEFNALGQIVAVVDSIFHSLIIRKRYLVIEKPVEEVIQAAHVALNLTPNCAQGKPLRALSVANCDSKFFERNRNLITNLLDVIFDDAVSDLGLERFLGAVDENDHWLLVAPLDNQLLPFQQLRIRATELTKTELTASYIVIVENEKCLHQLPQQSDTIAILGAGLNLSWLKASWLKKKTLAYWGDMDTWGLTMLADARAKQSHLSSLLMNQDTFDKYAEKFAVTEPQRAEPQPPSYLTKKEGEFYMKLFVADKGRLEQEFLPESDVIEALSKWRAETQLKTKDVRGCESM